MKALSGVILSVQPSHFMAELCAETGEIFFGYFTSDQVKDQDQIKEGALFTQWVGEVYRQRSTIGELDAQLEGQLWNASSIVFSKK